MKIKTRLVGALCGKKFYYTPIRVVVADVKEIKFDISPYGQCIIYTNNKTCEWQKNVMKQVGKTIDEFFNPLEDKVYVRCVLDEKDHANLAAGTHGGSDYWYDKERGGLPASFKPTLPGYYGYYIKGKRLETEEVGEVLLDLKTAKPVSGLMTFEQINADYKKKQKIKLEEMGLTEEDYRAVKLWGRIEFW